METITIESDSSLETFKENPVIDEVGTTIDSTQVHASSEASDSSPEVICTINSAAYGGFTKILSLLTSNMGKTDIFSIEEGKLSTISGGGYMYCDLSGLFGKNNFDIIDPQYNIKLLKLISGGDQVTFIDDEANRKYYVSNLVDGVPQINVQLHKPDQSMDPKMTKPDLGEIQEILDNINPDVVNTITTAEKNLDSQYFILEIIEEEAKKSIASISTDHGAFKFSFKESANEDEAPGVPGTSSTKYKLFNPFPIPKPDEIDFSLFKSASGELWVRTTSEVGMARIEYMERLTPMGIFDSFEI